MLYPIELWVLAHIQPRKAMATCSPRILAISLAGENGGTLLPTPRATTAAPLASAGQRGIEQTQIKSRPVYRPPPQVV
jgi:hypothetical protein